MEEKGSRKQDFLLHKGEVAISQFFFPNSGSDYRDGAITSKDS